MLANNFTSSVSFGTIEENVQKSSEFISELLQFIKEQIPRWRDRCDREPKTSETDLTSQLCAHLNSVTRHSTGWDILQFRIEEPDEKVKGRKIDLVSSPSGATIIIDGRRYSDFDTLLPIECKRLPTPKGKNRDEREYVFSQHSSTGGIQRFKAGHHGANHSRCAMIAYVQKETSNYWHTKISKWITGLSTSNCVGWTEKDQLQVEQDDATNGVMELKSMHAREKELSEINMYHIWIKME